MSLNQRRILKDTDFNVRLFWFSLVKGCQQTGLTLGLERLARARILLLLSCSSEVIKRKTAPAGQEERRQTNLTQLWCPARSCWSRGWHLPNSSGSYSCMWLLISAKRFSWALHSSSWLLHLQDEEWVMGLKSEPSSFTHSFTPLCSLGCFSCWNIFP